MDRDHLSYHALVTALRGEYGAMRKFVPKTTVDPPAGTWEAAYHRMKRHCLMPDDIAKEEAALARENISLLLRSDGEFPESLRNIPHAPFGIYVKGKLPRAALALAMVGTRRATPRGKKTAHAFARGLARAGALIVSGLAFGIDVAAHEGCLEAGGATIAVMAGGLDHVYPRSHERIAQRILRGGGALVSEYPPGEHPLGRRFIERNRIVSGLVRGVVIIEAPLTSGALATARFAAEQNRDLFVIPGNIDAPEFRGSHALIRGGAELVTSSREILEAYGVDTRTASVPEGSSPEEAAVLTAIAAARTALDVDKLSDIIKLEPRIVSRTLSFLLVRDIIKEVPGGYMLNQ